MFCKWTEWYNWNGQIIVNWFSESLNLISCMYKLLFMNFGEVEFLTTKSDIVVITVVNSYKRRTINNSNDISMNILKIKFEQWLLKVFSKKIDMKKRIWPRTYW